MYRVVVVDDEIWSVIGLKRILQEDCDRFELVYETTDSVDALEKICTLRPDIVFTDVRMPEMSGIELMHNVKARGIDTEFVVISGFAEFTYAQQALREGAIDYQLKPFARNTAKEMLDKLYKKLEARNKPSDLEFYSRLRDRKDHVPELLRSRFSHDLYNKLQLVLLYNKDSAESGIAIHGGDQSQSLSLKIGPRKWLCLINSEDDRTETVYQQLRSMEQEIESAAISRVGNSVGQFEQLLKEAETTLLDFFVYPESKIFRYRKARRDVTSQLEERISALYASGSDSKISATMSNLPKIFRDYDLGAADAVYFWNRMAYRTEKADSGERLEYLDIYELMERFSDFHEMCSYLTSLYQSEKVQQSGTVNDKFFEMLHYIDKNYAQHLSLKELCNMFYINMSYCCELFQKHKNTTFSQYLTDVRISKACELLKYHRATVSEACELVGYKDYFYFNKVFKKKMGCTPAEYRKSELVES